MKPHIIAVLPAFNESASIEALLSNFEKLHFEGLVDIEILVVNDGSTDDTSQKVKTFEGNIIIELLDNPQNGGLGKVLRQGLEVASEKLNPDDIIVTMDADNSHNPDMIPNMVKAILDGHDIIIASRYRKGSEIYGLSSFRKLTSFMAGSLFIVFASIPGVRDYTCGYRAYKASLVQKAMGFYEDKLIEEKGFSCMVELLLKLNKFRPKVKELPMVLRYDLKLSSSKMNIWATIKKTLAVLYRYRKGF